MAKKKHSAAFEEHGYDPMEDVLRYRAELVKALEDLESGEVIAPVISNSDPTASPGGRRGTVYNELRAEILAELQKLGLQLMNYQYPKKAQSAVSGQVDHDHRHTHESVSETAQWVGEMLGEPADGSAKEPRPH